MDVVHLLRQGRSHIGLDLARRFSRANRQRVLIAHPDITVVSDIKEFLESAAAGAGPFHADPMTWRRPPSRPRMVSRTLGCPWSWERPSPRMAAAPPAVLARLLVATRLAPARTCG